MGKLRTRFSTNVLSGSSSNGKIYNRLKLIGGGSLITCVGLHALIGSEDDYYCYRFITNKDPEDLVSFYGGEEFMELFCMFPFVVNFMMRSATFDDEGTVHTTGFPGEIQASMVFSDEEDEDTGDILWFNKRERFKDVFYGRKMWDTVHNFGFNRLPDGRIECYHHGEFFHGFAPPFSLIMKVLFQVQARWVAWATEHHVNHHAFTAETEEEEEEEELSRSNIALHLLKHHVWHDFKAMIFGPAIPAETQRSSTNEHSESEHGHEHEHEHKVSFLVHRKTTGGGDFSEEAKMNIKRSITMSRVSEDISMDRKLSNRVMTNMGIEPHGVGGRAPDAYRRATRAALQRHQTRVAERRITRKNTKKKSPANE